MSLDLLVLGGTAWLGGRFARRALEAGHGVTCLARGETGSAPSGVRMVAADRRDPHAYDRVVDRPWDVVLDVGRQPEQVRSAVTALAGRTRHWIYVSSCSVYADDSTPDADESAALAPPWSGTGPAGSHVLNSRHGFLSRLWAQRHR